MLQDIKDKEMVEEKIQQDEIKVPVSNICIY